MRIIASQLSQLREEFAIFYGIWITMENALLFLIHAIMLLELKGIYPKALQMWLLGTLVLYLFFQAIFPQNLWN